MKTTLKKSEMSLENIDSELVRLRYTKINPNATHELFLRIGEYAVLVNKSQLIYTIFSDYKKVKSEIYNDEYQYKWIMHYSWNREGASNFLFLNINQ